MNREIPFSAFGQDNQVQIKTEAGFSIRIYDLQGQLIVQQQVNSGITTIQIAQGMYLIQAVDRNKNTFTEKVIVR